MSKTTVIPASQRQLLENILSVESVTGNEQQMVSFILSNLKAVVKQHHPKFRVSYSKIGNIYVTFGYADVYPLLVAHTDTVHDIVVPSTTVKENNGKRITTEVLPYVVQHDTVRDQYTSPTGVGGDDKCGIFILLSVLPALLDQNIPCKMFFPVGEEKGFVGTTAALQENKKWFDDIGYAVELDRRGSSDIITDSKQWISPAFDEVLLAAVSPFGFKHAKGSVTDIALIHDETMISCCNMSCGYYNPHQASEFVDVEELWNTRNAVVTILSSVPPVRYPVTPVPVLPATKGYQGYGGYWDDDYAEYDWKGRWPKPTVSTYDEVDLQLPDGSVQTFEFTGYTVNPKKGTWYSEGHPPVLESAIKMLVLMRLNSKLSGYKQLDDVEIDNIFDWLVDQYYIYLTADNPHITNNSEEEVDVQYDEE